MKGLHYCDRVSIIHDSDPRIKLPVFFVLQILIAQANWYCLGWAVLVLAMFTVMSKSRFSEILSPLPALWIVMLFIMVFRLFPVQTEQSAWWQGLRDGLQYCLQLALMFSITQVMLSTTRINDIRLTILFYLRPFPLRFRYAFSLLVSLVFLFIARIAEIATDQRLAAINRGWGRSLRGPRALLRMLKLQTRGLMIHCFTYASDLEIALRSRRLQLVPNKQALIVAGYRPEHSRPWHTLASLLISLALLSPFYILSFLTN